MGPCCICGADASIFAIGMWWCEKHYKMKGKGSEKTSKAKFEIESEGKDTVDLGLKQV